MEPVTNITLSATLALATAFSGGLKALDSGDYSSGISQLTQVVESEASFNTIRPLALLYRAECHLGMNATNMFRDDIVSILDTSADRAVRRSAEELYSKAGLKDEDLAPKDGPEDVWFLFVTSFAVDREEDALSHCIGKWQKNMKSYLRTKRTDWFSDYSRQLLTSEVVEEHIGTKDDKGKAWLLVRMGSRQLRRRHGIHNDEMSSVELIREGGRWLISNLSHSGAVRGRSSVITPAESTTNRKRMRAIHRGLITYFIENEQKYPASLKPLVGKHVDGKDFFWIHPETDTPSAFVYCATLQNLTNSNPVAIVEPTAAGDTRLAIYINGLIAPLASEQLTAVAKEQAWPQIDGQKEDRSTRKLRKKVDKLVNKLRTGDSATRRSSKNKLDELGIAAFPYLQQYLKDEDPEIQATIADIIGE